MKKKRTYGNISPIFWPGDVNTNLFYDDELEEYNYKYHQFKQNFKKKKPIFYFFANHCNPWIVGFFFMMPGAVPLTIPLVLIFGEGNIPIPMGGLIFAYFFLGVAVVAFAVTRFEKHEKKFCKDLQAEILSRRK